MEQMIFTVTLYAIKGKSIFKELAALSQKTFEEFIPSIEDVEETVACLKAEGIKVEVYSEVGITCSCEKEKFEQLFSTTVVRKKVRGVRSADYFTYEFSDDVIIPETLNKIEKITLPRQLFVLNEDIRPELDYFHYEVPYGIRKVAKIEFMDKLGSSKKACNVGIIDTGLYHHRFFKDNQYRINVVSPIEMFDAKADERGHGTGMTSILVSLQDQSEVTMIKAANLNWSYPVAALQKAAQYNFDVLSCSWGIIGYEPQAYLEIANLIHKGVIVVFAAGNGATDRKKSIFQTIAYPDILSVGGCMVWEDGEIEVSDISSSYDSYVFEERHVPDLCGICGKLPYAQIILMPIQPGALFDVENGKRDGTKQDDGWFVSSGTSAATAYISGIITKLMEMDIVDKDNIIPVIKKACKKVHKGKNFMGEQPTDEGLDPVVGNGFLDFEGIYNELIKNN